MHLLIPVMMAICGVIQIAIRAYREYNKTIEEAEEAVYRACICPGYGVTDTMGEITHYAESQ